MKSSSNLQTPQAHISNTVASHPPTSDASAVKVVNSFDDDLLVGRLHGRTTGFTGGYSSDVQNVYHAVIPSYSGWNGYMQLPDPIVGTGAANIQMASSSAEDSPGGTGNFMYIVFYLDLSYMVRTEVVALNGTTPVTLLSKNVYHFQFAFPIARGATFGTGTGHGTLSSNVGTIWLGIGAFSGATGFATANYMWNRPGDGFLSSTIYVVPYGRLGTLWSVKFNSDTSISCSFRTLNRTNRSSPWTVNAEDNVSTGLVIQRSLSGGFMPAGAEFTVAVAKTVNSGTIAANFVLTAYEINAKYYSQGNPDF